MKTLKIGFIGAGNMATAIIRGMIGKGGYQPESIFAYDLNPLQLEKIGELGVQAMASAVEIVKQCDVVFLAVKPQNYEEVLPEFVRRLHRRRFSSPLQRAFPPNIL